MHASERQTRLRSVLQNMAVIDFFYLPAPPLFPRDDNRTWVNIIVLSIRSRDRLSPNVFVGTTAVSVGVQIGKFHFKVHYAARPVVIILKCHVFFRFSVVHVGV